MRRRRDLQRYLDFSTDTAPKIVQQWRAGYNAVSKLLDETPEILALVHKDLARLSGGDGARGRKGVYTSENILRALIVQQREGEDFRGAVVRIAESAFLRQFARLGNRPVMDFTFLNRCFNAIGPATWRAINDALKRYAVSGGRIDAGVVRADTTVVETTIHWPTDSSLLWDTWRVLARELARARKVEPGSCPHRFHSRKVKKHHLYITRYAASKSRARQRKVKSRFRRLIESARWIVGVAEGFVERHRFAAAPELMGAAAQIAAWLPAMKQALDVAERAQLRGQAVPACERVFSIFEPHTELVARGRRHKPVEFGHALLLVQTGEKFITHYDAMLRRRPDTQLAEEVLDEHEEFFGRPPEALAADGGFRAAQDKMAPLEERVQFLAIPERLGDWSDKAMVLMQSFRAGIEGTISVLKRAYRLLRSPFRGFKHFQSHIGLAVFCHNLAVLSG